MICCCCIPVSDYCHSFLFPPYVREGSGHSKPVGFPPVPIMDIDLSPRDGFLLIGLESGEINIATDVKTRLSMMHAAFINMYL